MVRRRRRLRISAAARARRALLADALAALLLALLVLELAAGLGVVGFFALPLLATLLLWIAAERLRRRYGSAPGAR
jgi:hypothetical protein